jgi:hypothetical protein
MATRKKASRKKAGSARGRTRGKAAKRSAAKKAGGSRRGSVTRARKRSTGKSRARKQIDRATRVARGVVEQATVAVVSGVDSLKELGGTIVDRVRGDQS